MPTDFQGLTIRGDPRNPWSPSYFWDSFVQKESPLFLRNRQRRSLHHLEQIFPDPPLGPVGLLAKDVARVIGHHERPAGELRPPAANVSEGFERSEAKQALRRG